MDYHNIIAAKLNLDLDYKKINDEILSCKDAFIYTPPKDIVLNDGLNGRVFKVADEEFYKNSDYIDTQNNSNIIVSKNFNSPYIFYLRTINGSTDYNENYAGSKRRDINEFCWCTNLIDKIPYTISIIENIFTKIGIVRVFVTKNTFIPAHRDYVPDSEVYKFYNLGYYSTDYKKVLGLSLIPSTGNVPLKIFSPTDKKIIDVPGNALLFNDSLFHGVPVTTGYRITLRIFGEVNYSQFDNKFDMEHTYFIKHN